MGRITIRGDEEGAVYDEITICEKWGSLSDGDNKN